SREENPLRREPFRERTVSDTGEGDGREGSNEPRAWPRNTAEQVENGSESRWPCSWANCQKKFGRLRLVPKSGLSAELLGVLTGQVYRVQVAVAADDAVL